MIFDVVINSHNFIRTLKLRSFNTLVIIGIFEFENVNKSLKFRINFKEKTKYILICIFKYIF